MVVGRRAGSAGASLGLSRNNLGAYRQADTGTRARAGRQTVSHSLSWADGKINRQQGTYTHRRTQEQPGRHTSRRGARQTNKHAGAGQVAAQILSDTSSQADRET